MPRALITGITGQDGYYMAELLNSKSYEIYGMVSGQSNPRADIVRRELPNVKLIEGDLQDISSLIAAIETSQPDEIYNLAAISFVGLSFKQPELTANVTGLGVLRLLEALRLVGGSNSPIRLYQASSSEMFGKVREVPQTENTPLYPRSPYGVAKAFAHHMIVNYRESYGIHAVSGICFNHESPKRGLEFVTRKITQGVARIKLGLQDNIALGNLEAKRDWGFAGDYVDAMWRMLQTDQPEDFVVATGKAHSVRDFCGMAFAEIGIENWDPYVVRDESFVRPLEVDALIGDAAKAREKLDWEPQIALPELVSMMVASDLTLERAKNP